jgi:hypothetical protein
MELSPWQSPFLLAETNVLGRAGSRTTEKSSAEDLETRIEHEIVRFGHDVK